MLQRNTKGKKKKTKKPDKYSINNVIFIFKPKTRSPQVRSQGEVVQHAAHATHAAHAACTYT